MSEFAFISTFRVQWNMWSSILMVKCTGSAARMHEDTRMLYLYILCLFLDMKTLA